MAVTLDLMEYTSDALAQAAYVSSDATEAIHLQQTVKGADAGYYEVYGGTGNLQEEAQEFTPTASIICHQIKLYLYKTGSPTDNVYLTIRTDSSGLPSGTILGTSGTIAGSSIATVGTEYTFTFTTPVLLSSGVTYHFVISRDGARDTANYYRINVDDT